MRIEDYALIGDTRSAALVGRDGSIDWLCLPRFDSPACFARLLGDESNGFWRLAPAGHEMAARRAYLDDTLILETVWETATGTVKVIDFMPPRHTNPDLVRIVEGVSGTVDMTAEISIRFDYGRVVPWARCFDGHFHAIGGPDSVWIHAPLQLEEAMGDRHTGTFTIAAGQRRASCSRGAHRTTRNPHTSIPASSSPRPGCSGRNGSHIAGSRAPGTMPWSAPSSRSRRSPTARPAASWRPPPRRCPSISAGSATGTTDTAGCATPR